MRPSPATDRSFVESPGRDRMVTLPCALCGREVRVRSYGYGGKIGLWVYPGTRAMRLMCEEQHPEARTDHAHTRRRDRHV
jgi:hypothetical protein